MLANYEEKLGEIRTEIISIGNGLLKANQLIVEGLKKCEQSNFVEAKLYITNVSNKVKDIDNNIITTLALHSPEAKDLRMMVSYLKITNELLGIVILKTKELYLNAYIIIIKVLNT